MEEAILSLNRVDSVLPAKEGRAYSEGLGPGICWLEKECEGMYPDPVRRAGRAEKGAI